MVVVDKYLLDENVSHIFNVNPAAQQIIFALLIIFWVVKICWFTYDKFHLERKERNLKMDREREDINGIRIKNGQSGKN